MAGDGYFTTTNFTNLNSTTVSANTYPLWGSNVVYRSSTAPAVWDPPEAMARKPTALDWLDGEEERVVEVNKKLSFGEEERTADGG